MDFYAAYSEILAPELLKLYNHIFETESLPETLRQAVIIVIPKPGKDPQSPESYRPISLLQADIKILAKILAMHLNNSILSLIHPDQTGFMPGKNTAMNLRRLHMNIQADHENMGDRAVVALGVRFGLMGIPLGMPTGIWLWSQFHKMGTITILLPGGKSGGERMDIRSLPVGKRNPSGMPTVPSTVRLGGEASCYLP